MMMGMAARETMDARWSAVMRRGTRARERVVFLCVSFGRSSGPGAGRVEVESRRARRFGGDRARSHRIATERGKRDDGDDDMTRAMDDDEDDED